MRGIANFSKSSSRARASLPMYLRLVISSNTPYFFKDRPTRTSRQVRRKHGASPRQSDITCKKIDEPLSRLILHRDAKLYNEVRESHYYCPCINRVNHLILPHEVIPLLYIYILSIYYTYTYTPCASSKRDLKKKFYDSVRILRLSLREIQLYRTRSCSHYIHREMYLHRFIAIV